MLKEKLEYRPKSQIDPVSVTTKVNDRLDKLKDSSANWKNRVEAKDAEKFTVAAKTSNQPAELPFTKSQVRTCAPMVDFHCANPSPLGLAKSPSMVVSSSTANGGSHKALMLELQLPAFSRSVSVPGGDDQQQLQNGSGVKVTVPKLDEDRLFDKFFTTTTPSPQEETKLDVDAEWDLDAITSTQRWVVSLSLGHQPAASETAAQIRNEINLLLLLLQTDP